MPRGRLVLAAVATALLLVPAGVAGAQEPIQVTIDLDPDRAPPGAVVDVSGTNCPKDLDPPDFTDFPETRVSLWLGGAGVLDQESWGLGIVPTEEDGTYEGTFTLPVDGSGRVPVDYPSDVGTFLAPGDYPLYVSCEFFGDGVFVDSLTTGFTVEPYPQLPAGLDDRLTFDPEPAAADGSVTVTLPGADGSAAVPLGSGFWPFQQVAVVLYRDAAPPVVVGETTMGSYDADIGRVPDAQIDVALPADAAGETVTVAAFGRLTFNSLEPFSVPEVSMVAFQGQLEIEADETEPPDPPPPPPDPENGDFEPPAEPPEADGELGLGADAVEPGGEVAVGGDGFEGGEDVYLVLYSTPVVLDTVEADGDGRINTQVTIPADTAPGPHELVAFGSDSGRVLSSTITVIADEVEPPDRCRAVPAPPNRGLEIRPCGPPAVIPPAGGRR